MTRRGLLLGALAAPTARAGWAQVRTGSFILASTTSTQESGLFDQLLPRFTDATGIPVRVVALGTGQALDVGRRGDADGLLVHDRAAEERFVAEGWAAPPGRRPVMYNDFVLIGPAADPAGIAGLRDAPEALRRIARAATPFVSRGDRSGTHAAELRLWALARVDPTTGRGAWYREVGQGMGAALNIAAASGAYLLSDRGTWLAFRNHADLRVLAEGDGQLFNQYGVMVVNPARHPGVHFAPASSFANWITGAEGQAAIAAYRINGEQVFYPNAGDLAA